MLAFNSYAQTSVSLSKDEKTPTWLQSHILIHQDSIAIKALQSILIKKTPVAIQLNKKETLQPAFLKEFLKHNTKLVLITEDINDSIQIKYPTINQIKPEHIEALKLNDKLFKDDKSPSFKGNQKYGSVIIENFNTIPDSLFLKLWQHSGKLPNFIYSNQLNLKLADSVVTQLNTTKRILGKISSEKIVLENVTFKNSKNKAINGHFSFPIDSSKPLPVMIPHKIGYHFSPDIIYVSPENLNNPKEFKAFKLDADFGLSDYFDFDKMIHNRIRNNNSEIISNNITIIRDNEFGKVGLFENRAYIDAGLESRASLQGSFTIASWIKPTQLTKNNSILGKGDNFVLKLHNGFLTFTMADVKDYISTTSAIPLNKWSHITLVHSKINNTLLFYVNGELTDTVPLIADYTISNFNLLIGSNLWEEFFIGAIGEIKIWERELNTSEIFAQYKMPKNKFIKSNSKVVLIGGSAIVSMLIALILFLKKRKKILKPESYTKTTLNSKSNILIDNESSIEKIYCFGELQIINNKGFDVATKLSPKLKNLFLLIFLHSTGNQNGISSKKLTEILWPGMTAKNAKNTRGTNIQNLRGLLALCSEIQLVFEAKKWRIDLTENCFCDYHIATHFFETFSTKSATKEVLDSEYIKLITLLKRGRFLVNSNDAWLDPFIEKFSNKLIENNNAFINELKLEEHSKLLFNIAEVTNIYDDLNEKSLQLKLQVLRYQGKLSLARKVYDNFVKLYKNVYNENYKPTFDELISENLSF